MGISTRLADVRPLGASVSPAALLPLGRSFFAAALIGSGLLQLVSGELVRLVPKLPAWIPASPAWAYATGVLLVSIGAAVLSERLTRVAATVLISMIAVDLLVLYLPQMVVNAVVDRPLLRGFMYTNPLKALALAGGAAILIARAGRDRGVRTSVTRGRRQRLETIGAVLLAVFLIVCGMQHFAYNDFVTLMVPAWIPGRRFWAYFTGVCLFAGGAGILWPPTARLAPSLAALMIFLWVPLVHIPRAITGPNHVNETAGVFEALALSGVALIVAATRGRDREN